MHGASHRSTDQQAELNLSDTLHLSEVTLSCMSKTITQNSTPPTPIIDSPSEWVREHIESYVKTDGAEGHNWNGVPCMLLTTQGRKTGSWNRSALIYGTDGNDLVLIASKGGAPSHPLWFENLVQNPQIWVQVGADKYWATAHVVDPTTDADKRTRLWKSMAAIWPGYDEYQIKADEVGRVIPVVVITRN